MKFRTEIPLEKQAHYQINYHSKLFLLGSCFSENIGDKLSYYKFQSVQNPMGILFHPKAIEQLILNSINGKPYKEEDVFELNEGWHCFDAHSKMSSSAKKTLLQNLNIAIATTKKRLTDATHIIITLGTAWIYRYIKTDTIVTNCHKIPQKYFLKELLSVDEIVNSLNNIVTLIRSINPSTSIIFTISPVRHMKDGFIQNQRSKSHLIAGVHEVVASEGNNHYFPSYEIMMDELRDYRFYREDMIHPNTIAIQYVWEKFINCWFEQAALPVMKRVEEIQKGINHKPFHPNAKAHHRFLEKLKFKKEQLTKEYGFMEF